MRRRIIAQTARSASGPGRLRTVHVLRRDCQGGTPVAWGSLNSQPVAVGCQRGRAQAGNPHWDC
eukprot:6319155-Pyramimonas_sp.AAC.1